MWGGSKITFILEWLNREIFIEGKLCCSLILAVQASRLGVRRSPAEAGSRFTFDLLSKNYFAITNNLIIFALINY